MGSGITKQQASATNSSKKSHLDNVYPTKVFIDKVLVKAKLFSGSNEWADRRVYYTGDFVKVCDVGNIDSTVEFDLKIDLHIEQNVVNDNIELTLRQDDYTVLLRMTDDLSVETFVGELGKCVIEVKSMVLEGASNGMLALMDILDHVPCLPEEKLQQESHQHPLPSPTAAESITLAVRPRTPSMKIVILVVGTRGDVSPFVHLALALKDLGHTVRIATHTEYRDVVTSEGLKYYPLAGDPRKLSEYMVKTGGRLMPDLTSAEERAAIPEKMLMLKEITHSTWPACTQPDPEDETAEPFVVSESLGSTGLKPMSCVVCVLCQHDMSLCYCCVSLLLYYAIVLVALQAEAIISNPVSYGHIHCAEALCIPLHIMFPQPWHSTKCFPHPLSNMSLDNRWSMKNKMSFHIVDEFMWMGLRSMINDFRTEVLKLQPFRIGEGGESVIEQNEVPISHMWSSSFVPRCADWPLHVDVVGDFTRQKRGRGGGVEERELAPPAFLVDPRLASFLEQCGESPPIFIGFGSMVIGNSAALVEMVKVGDRST